MTEDTFNNKTLTVLACFRTQISWFNYFHIRPQPHSLLFCYYRELTIKI